MQLYISAGIDTRSWHYRHGSGTGSLLIVYDTSVSINTSHFESWARPHLELPSWPRASTTLPTIPYHTRTMDTRMQGHTPWTNFEADFLGQRGLKAEGANRAKAQRCVHRNMERSINCRDLDLSSLCVPPWVWRDSARKFVPGGVLS